MQTGHAAAAERAIRDALSQDAGVEKVSRGVAERLGAIGGIVAGLRFGPAVIDVPMMA